MKKGNIKNIIDSMLDSIGKENVELYKSLIDNRKFTDINNIKQFYFQLIYPYNQFLSGLIQSEISKNGNIQFILKHSDFIQNHFQKYIENIEGSTYCADKSKTILNAIYRFYDTAQEIVFNYEQEYTFHLPTKIFKTHDSIIEFYESLVALYYGNNVKYLKALLNISLELKEQK